MEMFGAVDRTTGGAISSQMPAWYNETKVDDLREEIGRMHRSLSRGEVPPEHAPEVRANIERLQRKLDGIMSSKPHIGDPERNLLWKYYKELASLITATLFSYDEMQRGLASPHEEARRMKDAIINLTPELCDLAVTSNVGLHGKGKNMVSRDGASKMFKLCGKLLGEPTNIESMRPVRRGQGIQDTEIVSSGTRGKKTK